MKSTDLHVHATGDRLRWHLRSADTDGRLVRVEWWIAPGGLATCAAHGGGERLEVLAGTLGAELDGRPLRLGKGERLSIPEGARRRWWNAGDGELHLMVEVAPPGDYEEAVAQLFETTIEGGTR